jgi:hypothetical protein
MPARKEEQLADTIEDLLQPLPEKYGLPVPALCELTLAIIEDDGTPDGLRLALNRIADDYGIPVAEWLPVSKELIDMISVLNTSMTPPHA